MIKIISSIILMLPFALNAQNTNVYEELAIEWVEVKGGTFEMGSNYGDPNENSVHTVNLDSYSISKYEVTFDQYDFFCEATGRKKAEDIGWGREQRPVINVKWDDAVAFCEWLSLKTGAHIHLPTEAQWEYAARGGEQSKDYLFSGSNNMDSVGWYAYNSDKIPQPVGQKKSNELGIYDMSGNVFEWCNDWYSEDYYTQSHSNNPQGPSSGYLRVIRGGSWFDLADFHRNTKRAYFPPNILYWHIGFRIVRE